MNVSTALNATSSPVYLDQFIGIQMLDKVKSLETNQAAVALQDFAAAQPQAPHPFLGGSLDIIA